MFQPDSIHVVQSHGVEYIITANEGDVKDYSDLPLLTTGFSESVRVKDLTLSGTCCLILTNWLYTFNKTNHLRI